MHTLVLANPLSGNASQARDVIAKLADRPGVLLALPEPAELPQVLQSRVASGYRNLIIIGGDGTVHQIINALGDQIDNVTLGVIPSGTGNDLARSLAIPLDPKAAIDIIDCNIQRRIDLLEIRTTGKLVLGVNIASGGLSGLVSEAASSLAKLRWGTLAYVFGAAESASTLTTYQAQMVLDGGTEIRCAALSVLVANGRFAGGGWNVASPADLEDGLLDLILIPAGPLVELAGVAADLLAGDYLDSGLVEHHRVAAVELSSQPIMPFRIDGEPLTGDTLTFSVRPACLRVFVGPDYFSRETD